MLARRTTTPSQSDSIQADAFVRTRLQAMITGLDNLQSASPTTCDVAMQTTLIDLDSAIPDWKLILDGRRRNVIKQAITVQGLLRSHLAKAAAFDAHAILHLAIAALRIAAISLTGGAKPLREAGALAKRLNKNKTLRLLVTATPHQAATVTYQHDAPAAKQHKDPAPKSKPAPNAHPGSSRVSQLRAKLSAMYLGDAKLNGACWVCAYTHPTDAPITGRDRTHTTIANCPNLTAAYTKANI